MATATTPIGKLFQDAGFEQGISLNLSRAAAQVSATNLLGRHDAIFEIRACVCSHGGQEVSVMTTPKGVCWTERKPGSLRLTAALPGPYSTEEQREESRQQLATIVIALQSLIEEEVAA